MFMGEWWYIGRVAPRITAGDFTVTWQMLGVPRGDRHRPTLQTWALAPVRASTIEACSLLSRRPVVNFNSACSSTSQPQMFV